MAKEISALDLRKRFGAIMDEVRYRREPYIVKKNGRPMMVLLDVEAYKGLKEGLQEEAFIEEYSRERMAEFLREDKLDRATRTRIRKWLDR
jgi:prevent-host-death family protein